MSTASWQCHVRTGVLHDCIICGLDHNVVMQVPAFKEKSLPETVTDLLPCIYIIGQVGFIVIWCHVDDLTSFRCQ